MATEGKGDDCPAPQTASDVKHRRSRSCSRRSSRKALDDGRHRRRHVASTDAGAADAGQVQLQQIPSSEAERDLEDRRTAAYDRPGSGSARSPRAQSQDGDTADASPHSSRRRHTSRRQEPHVAEAQPARRSRNKSAEADPKQVSPESWSRPGTSASAAGSKRSTRSTRSTRDAPAGARAEEAQTSDGGRQRVLLSCCKGETHSHREGFRRLARRLHEAGWQPEKLNPHAASLADGPVTAKALQGAALTVFGCPMQPFTAKEIAALHAHVDQGGSLLVCGGPEGEHSSNLNDLLQRYGTTFNDDALISVVQQGLHPPRHVVISEGLLCTAAAAAAADDDAGPAATAAHSSSNPATHAPAASIAHKAQPAAEMLYADGCTIAVSGTAQPILLSGSMCNPPLRPLAAVWRGAPDMGCGRVAAFGTAAVFDREALQLPGNSAACDLLFDWLLPGSNADLGLPPLQTDTDKRRQRRPLDILEQSEQPRVCFQLDAPLLGDWTQLFADDLFEFGLRLPEQVAHEA